MTATSAAEAQTAAGQQVCPHPVTAGEVCWWCPTTAYGADRRTDTSPADEPTALPLLPFQLPAGTTVRDGIMLILTTVMAAGATDAELERALARPHQTVSAARHALVKRGRVTDSGRTRSGAKVWVAVV